MSAQSWGRLVTIVTLFSLVFWPNLRRLWEKTNPFTGEANWQHAICVPIIGLYYLYVHREDIAAAGPRQFLWSSPTRRTRLGFGLGMIIFAVVCVLASNFIHGSMMVETMVTAIEGMGILGLLVLLMDWSLAVTFFGIGVYVYGIYPGQNDYLKDIGMIVTLFGIVLMMDGPAVMKIAWFPIVFLICAIPWPGLVYSWIASPLQVLAASVAVMVLKITGVNALTSGTKIIIFGNTVASTRMLNVAEAPAPGMRSLMTFITVGGAVGFLSDRPLWQKITITVSAVPIAIFCNVMRVSGQGLLDHYVSTKLSESFAHQFVGMIMLIPAFFMILMVGYVLDKLFIEEVDEDAEPAPAGVVTIPHIQPTVVTPVAAAPTPAPVAAPKAPKPAAILEPAKVAAIPARPAAIPPAAKPLPRPNMGVPVNPRPPVVRPPNPAVRRPPGTPPAAKPTPPAAPPPRKTPPPPGSNPTPEGT